MQLRTYQSNFQEAIRTEFRKGKRRVLGVSPTASGKTVVFASITHGAVLKGKRIIIIAHRSEILDQISKALAQFSVPHGRLQSGRTMSLIHPVQVASIGTLANRLDVVPEPDMVIADEAHHACASQWVKVFAAWPNARWLGVTATPERLDGRGLGEFFESMVHGPSVAWLIAQGFLSRPEYYAPPTTVDTSDIKKTAGDFNKHDSAEVMDKPTITGNAVEHYKRLCPGSRAIAFCVTIEHARHVSEQFSACGISSEVIDGTLNDEDRASRIENLRTGKTLVMTSCELVSEGFDLPCVDAAILLRPTWSLGLHLQQLGRALRPAPGKTVSTILDHVGNTLRHGLAEDPRIWSLEGKKARKKKEALIEAKQCEVCYAIFQGKECPSCGAEPESNGRQIEEVAGTLQKLTPEQREAQTRSRKDEERNAVTMEELIALGHARGYAKPEAWARIRFQNSWRRFYAKKLVEDVA